MKSALQTVRKLDVEKSEKLTIVDCLLTIQKSTANHFDYKLFDDYPCHIYLKEDSSLGRLIENDEYRENISDLRSESIIEGYNHYVFHDFGSMSKSRMIYLFINYKYFRKYLYRQSNIRDHARFKYMRRTAKEFLTTGTFFYKEDFIVVANHIHEKPFLAAIKKFFIK